MTLSIILVSLVLGLMVAFQFRTTNRIEQGIPFDRAQELAIEKNELEKETEKLNQETHELLNKLNQMKKGQDQATKTLKSELARLKLLAGLVPVSGPGIEIVLENPPSEKMPGLSPSIYEVTDMDLLKVTNELWGARAEAIAINGQRITTLSEIRLGGSFININTVRIYPPYHVIAIGPPETLKSTLEIKGGLVEYMQNIGIKISVEKRNQLTIPAYSGNILLSYVKDLQGR